MVPQSGGSSSLTGGSDACTDNLVEKRAPVVSVSQSLLWPPNHSLRDVGLIIDETAPCEGRVTTRLAVYSDEPDEDPTGDGSFPGDARIQAPDLFLRSERKGDADGRVYLLLATATLPDGTAGTACETVVVPQSRSKSDLDSVRAQAQSAQAYCAANAEAPSAFLKLTEGVLAVGNAPPVVHAGPDQAVDVGSPASLNGTATDDGRPTGALAVSWSAVSGPGSVTFSPPDAAQTSASFSAAGAYTLRLTATDSQLSASDDVDVVVSQANTAPSVDAGPDREVTLPDQAVALLGQVTDDGRPAGATLSITWSVVSPAGAAVVFADASAPQTAATLPGVGDYVLQLTASDTQFQVSDDVKVTVHPEPPPILTVPDAAAVEGQEGATGALLDLSLSKPWSQPVTVDYMTADGTAVAGCDYRTRFGTVRFGPGQTTAQVLVPIMGEQVTEGDETVVLRVGNVSQATLSRTDATITILNDDAANAAPSAPFARTPPDRSTGLALPPTLTWSATDPDAGDTLTHDLYLGSSFGTSGQSWARTCPSSQGPGGRQGAVSGYDEANDRLILFGGTAADDAVWILDSASAAGGVPQWTPLPTSGGPTGLTRAAAAYDAATNRLFVHGGCTGECALGSDETWVLSNANGIGGTPAWSSLPLAGPGARVDHAAAMDPTTRRLIVFGGSEGASGAALGDVWVLRDLDGQPAWEPLQPTGGGPAPRAGMTLSYDAEANALIVFGGRSGTQALSDIWVLRNANGTSGTPEWVRLAPAGSEPPARWGHVAAFDPVIGRLVVFGGSTAAANASARFVFSDVWMLNGAMGGAAPQWIRLTPSGGPTGRVQPAAAFSASANRLIVVGGATKTSGVTDEVWVLADTIGTLPLVSGSPAPGFTADDLVPGAPYFWRIVTRDSHGAWRGSTAWRFTSNNAPLVDAGPDQTITLAASASLMGSVSDDGLPAGSALVFQWTQVGGPGTATIADPGALATPVTLPGVGEYVLRLSASDGALTATDDLVIRVVSTNDPPSVNAGPDQTVKPTPARAGKIVVNADEWTLSNLGFAAAPDAAEFARNVAAFFTGGRPGRFLVQSSNVGLRGSALAGVMTSAGHTWVYSTADLTAAALDGYDAVFLGGTAVDTAILTQYVQGGGGVYLVSGTGAIGNGAPAEAAAWRPFLNAFGLDLPNAYDALSGTFELSSGHPLFAGVQALYFSNTLPLIDLDPANLDARLLHARLGSGLIAVYEPSRVPLAITAATLAGAVSDDGRPAATLSQQWTQLGGPASVTFDDPTRPDTIVGLSDPGDYDLRLSASDGEFTRFDDVRITLLGNQAPIVAAGADQRVNYPTAALLDATVTDDGLPSAALTFSWSVVSGPGTVSIGDPMTPLTAVAFSAPGRYVLRASATDSDRTAADDVVIDVETPSCAAIAGALGWWPGENDGTDLIGGRTAVPSEMNFVPGEVGQAFGTHASVPEYAWGVTSFTLEAWVRPTGLFDAERPILEFSSSQAIGVHIWHSLNAATTAYQGGAVFVNLVDESGTSHFFGAGPGALHNREWNHVALAYDHPSGLARLYVNGRRAAEKAVGTFAPRTNLPLNFGHRPPSRSFVGGLDEVTLFGRALSLQEIETIYRAGSAGKCRADVVPPPNQPPQVDAGPDQSVTTPGTALDGTVTDDGLPAGSTVSMLWTAIDPPAPVTFSSATTADTMVTFSSSGTYFLTLTASDTAAQGFDVVRIDVELGNQPPSVNAGADAVLTLPANTLTLSGTASDDGLPLGSTLTLQWSQVSGPPAVTFATPTAAQTDATLTDPGTYVLRLKATDGSLTGSDDVVVTVMAAPPSGNPPVAGLTSPSEGTALTDRTTVSGNARSTSLASWRLEYRLEGEGTYTRFAGGTTEVQAATLGTFDPTLLLNGLYEIRLTATDLSGRIAQDSVRVVVKDNQKIGHFSVSFADLEVPLAGLPIRVSRTYDSRDKGKGDFGPGWRLDLSNVRVAESGTLGMSWAGTIIPGFFPTYCLQPLAPTVVTVTLPDGRVLEFEPTITPQCQTFVPIQEATIGFRARPGTVASLSPAGDGFVYVEGGWPGTMQLFDGSTYDVFDPSDYVLTFPDGRQLSLNEARGLTQIRDLNGNVLSVSTSGITHSSGRGVAFTRNAEGRITRITDPEDNVLQYGYDANGDLASYKDREENETTFTYHAELPHVLEAIRDPLGRTPVRNEYFEDGRIKSHTDAFGKRIEYTHDLSARQEVVKDRNDTIRVLEYDERGNVVKETQPDGKVVRRTFNLRNNRTSETLPHDPATANPPATGYTYDDRDNVLTVTDPETNTTEHTYNSRNQVMTIKDPRGHFTINAYDDKGNLTSTKVTQALGGPALTQTSYTYFPDGSLKTQTTVVDGVPATTTYAYDTTGNLTQETDALGHATTYTYDRNGNRLTQTTTRTTPAGAETLTTTYQYDRQGRLVKTIDPDGTFTRTVYDELGRQKETYDKLDRRTSFEYDEMGRLTKTTYADGTFEQSTYDNEGRRLTSRDRGGRITSHEYDDLGRLRKTTFPDLVFTQNTYDAAGRLVEAKDARGKTTFYAYDAAGRRTSVRVPLTTGVFAETLFTNDANGNQKTVRDPNGKTTTFEYDEQNRRTKTIFPDTTYTETTYDTLGRRRSERDQAGKLTRYEYDLLSRLTKVIDALNHETVYGYDELGNRTSQTDAENRTTRFEFDKLGRETARVLPDGKREEKTYWPTGSLKTRTDFMGRTTSYEYDVNQRLESRTYPAGTLPAVSFTYTPTGRRDSVTIAGASTEYDYDDRDRLKALTYPDGRKLEYEYDQNGNRKTLKATIGSTVLVTGFTYDDANRLDVVTDPAGRAYDHGYDLNGNRESLSQPNGTVTGYTYDELNRLKTLTTTHPLSGVTIQSYAFTLGPSGNRTKISEGDGAVRDYTYDDLYRLTGEKVIIGGLTEYEKFFTYDKVGNRKTQDTTGAGSAGTPTAPGSLTYGFDARDRLESEGGTLAGQPIGINYGYDDNGNLLTKSGEATYTWDLENRLIRATKTDGTVVDHVYDADGVRLQTTTTLSGQPAEVTNYLVDTSTSLSHAVAETDAVGALKAYYVRADDLLAVMRPRVQAPAAPVDWQTRYVHPDGIGSVRRLTDETGTITDGYTYTAFGELLAHTGSDPQPYAFAGEPCDPNVGFQYHRARWLDPRSARFLSMDIWGGSPLDPVSLHRYLYGGNDPVNKGDPSGLVISLLVYALIGTRVHQEIGIDFELRGPERVSNYVPIAAILGLDPHACRPLWALCALQPDLVDGVTNEVYEIKPFRSAGLGQATLALELFVMNANDPEGQVWTPGITYFPPKVLQLEGGWTAVVSPPANGVITYEVFNLPAIIAVLSVFALSAALSGGAALAGRVAVQPAFAF